MLAASIDSLYSTSTSRHYDPETDAPPAGVLLSSSASLGSLSQRDLFLAAFVVPVAVCLLLQCITWAWAAAARFSRRLSGSNNRGGAQRSKQQQQQHRQQQPPSSPDSASHRHRHSRPRPTNEPQPPPLHTYQQQQQHWMMDGPQTERPFRRTQSQRPPSPQSERPFRVTQSHTVMTPGSSSPATTAPSSARRTPGGSGGLFTRQQGHISGQTPPAAPASAAAVAATTTTDRPFRVSKTANTPRVTLPHSPPSSTRLPLSTSPTAAGRRGSAAAPAAVSPAPPSSDKPFRFRDSVELEQQQQQQYGRAAAAAAGPNGTTPGSGVPLLFTSPPAQQQQQQQQTPTTQGRRSPQQQVVRSPPRQQQQQQAQRKSPVWGLPLRKAAAAAAATGRSGGRGRAQPVDDVGTSSEEEEVVNDSVSQAQHGWDPALLSRCAASAPYISSVEGLQQSAAYRTHITGVRQRQLTFDIKEKHKLDVYKALRRVDPESFRQLFTRREVLEYDELPLSWPLALLDTLLTSALTWTLLGLPLWSSSEHTPWPAYRAPLAAVWLLLQLCAMVEVWWWWGAGLTGCTSLLYRALSIHATQGVYGAAASWWRLLAAVVLDAGVTVCLPLGLGTVASLACRLLTTQRQSCGERLLRLQPMREVVGPTRFSQYYASPSSSPGPYGVVAVSDDSDDDGGIATDDDDE